MKLIREFTVGDIEPHMHTTNVIEFRVPDLIKKSTFMETLSDTEKHDVTIKMNTIFSDSFRKHGNDHSSMLIEIVQRLNNEVYPKAGIAMDISEPGNVFGFPSMLKEFNLFNKTDFKPLYTEIPVPIIPFNPANPWSVGHFHVHDPNAKSYEEVLMSDLVDKYGFDYHMAKKIADKAKEDLVDDIDLMDILDKVYDKGKEDSVNSVIKTIKKKYK